MLRYSAICSLDGYVVDAAGSFTWAAPDEQVHQYVNNQERDVGTYLYGRRMYETMRVWDDDAWLTGEPETAQDYARVWRAADKIVYSSTLREVTTGRTRIEAGFDPPAVHALVESAGHDVSIGGATLAASALRAGLVAEIHLFLAPIVVGGGTPALPDDVRIRLELLDERRFDSGFVHLHYRVFRSAAF